MGLFFKKIPNFLSLPLRKSVGSRHNNRIYKTNPDVGPGITGALVLERSLADLIKLPERDTQTA
jgi:hypothetical protein